MIYTYTKCANCGEPVERNDFWNARAERAVAEWNQAMNGIGKYEPEQWKRVEHLCSEKAKEYK